jgi:hypothetical protein
MAATVIDDFWAVTSYFNPVGYVSRRANYRQFRDQLKLPLLTVELAFERGFELGESDADILVSLSGGDVMWQKERLLNLAVRALPASCRKVAWLDCDIVLERDDWIDATRELLDRHKLVQPFSRVLWMPPPDERPGGTPSTEPEVPNSTASVIATGMSIEDCLGVPSPNFRSSPGFAWAANRDLLEEVGIYDCCIAGGGDSVFVRAAYGRFDDAVRLHLMNQSRRAHFMAWASRLHDAVRGDVTFVNGVLRHLWHGSWHDRAYRERYQGLAAFAFDPSTDIALDGNGVWRWNSQKPAMHDYVRRYLEGRREDG